MNRIGLYLLIILSTCSLFAQKQQERKDEDNSILISLKPTEGKFTVPQDIRKIDGTVLFTDREFRTQPNLEFANPIITSKYWKNPNNNRRKLSFSMMSQVVEPLCIDCIETQPGMFQMMVLDKATAYRVTFHREMKANLFRFQFMHELGYKIPQQSFLPHMRINFSSKEEKEAFKMKLKVQFAHGGQKKWSDWISEEGKDWLQLKDALVEKEPRITKGSIEVKDYKLGYHWLNFDAAEIDKSRAIRGLLLVLLMTDWGESTEEINTGQFLRKHRGYLYIKHPLAYDFKDRIHISDIRWIARKILMMNNAPIMRAIDHMNVARDEAGRMKSKFIAILDHVKKTIFMKSEQDIFPELPKSGLNIKNSASIPALKKNWRFYVMLGVDRLARLATDALGDLAELEWNKTLAKIGPEQKNVISDFLNGDDKKAIPLTFGTISRAGINVRYSRDLVRGQYYGNTDLANLADTVIYGAGAQVGLQSRFFDELPISAYKSFRFERKIVHLKPVKSLDEAADKFWRDNLLYKEIRNWRGYFRDTKCKYDKKANSVSRHDCSDVTSALDKFADDFKLNETLIMSTDVSYPWGFNIGLPRTDFLYGINVFRGSRIGGEFGRSTLKRYSMRSTKTGLQIIITDSVERFKRYFFNLKMGLTIFDYQYEKNKASPETQIFNIDYKVMDESEKIDAFLAIQGVLVYRDTSYLENYFQGQTITNNVVIERKRSPVYGTNLIPREKDVMDISNVVEISNKESDEDLRVFEVEDTEQINLVPEDRSRNLVLIKTVKRKYWDFIGVIEDFLRTFLIPIKLRGVRDGENAGDLKRGAQIDVVVTEADLTDRTKGLFEPVIILKKKLINWKIKGDRVKKKLNKLARQYKDIHDDVSFPEIDEKAIKSMKQFELNQVIVFKSSFVKQLSKYLAYADEKSLEKWGKTLDKSIVNSLMNFKDDMDVKSDKERLELIHLMARKMMNRMKFPEIIKFFKGKNIEHDIQLEGWQFKSGVEKPEFISLSLTGNAEIGESVFSRIVRELDLPEYEIRGSYMTFGF